MSAVEDKLSEEYEWHCTNDNTQKLLVFELQKRAAEGFAKYGVTLERDDLTKEDWFQHLKEELLDACNYATRLEMYNELTFSEREILEDLKYDLFHALEGIYENNMS